MEKIKPDSSKASGLLATDLDGTLIPLFGNDANRRDLEKLGEAIRSAGVGLMFVTGRHLELVEQAIVEEHLPAPDWVLGDVGASIYRRDAGGGFHYLDDYGAYLDSIIAAIPIVELQERLGRIGGIRLQESEKQGRFKLSYYCDAEKVRELEEEVEAKLADWAAPYSLIASVDPFTNEGLIDLLPQGVSKAHALEWWADRTGHSRNEIVFSGDSGNDFAAMTAGFKTIVVGNSPARLAGEVREIHEENGWRNRLYHADGHATSGVLEGCRWFELIEEELAVGEFGFGATPVSVNRTFFKVWAPSRQQVEVQIGREELAVMDRTKEGVFTVFVGGARPGDRYQFRLDGTVRRPDPASRFQPEGVHGPSEIVDPKGFAWRDQNWRGVPRDRLVIYEIHVGTFTGEGTFRSAMERLDELVDLGITAVEVMPVAQAPGRWNWGYDGIDFFAPTANYGHPRDFKAFVDGCHERGLAVILDVVYNHAGPEGNYLADFGPYFSGKHRTPWGPAFNFDGENAGAVRDFVRANACYWIEEFHLDGLRLDAIRLMHDESPVSIVAEIAHCVREIERTLGRPIHLIGESNVYDSELLEEGYNAIWSDEIPHGIFSILTKQGRVDGREYRGAVDLASCLDAGFLYEYRRGIIERNDSGKRGRLSQVVQGLQTHDQVGNHPRGLRLSGIQPNGQRAAAALVLLYPSIPFIFMGEEFAAPSPFCFFVDYGDESLREAVVQGRQRDYGHHDWSEFVSPVSDEAFHRSKLAPQSAGDAKTLAWYIDLLSIRREWIESGILSEERLKVRHDPARRLFILDYGKTWVAARLTTPEESEVEPVSMGLDGVVLKHSDGESNDLQFLGSNQAAIGRR